MGYVETTESLVSLVGDSFAMKPSEIERLLSQIQYRNDVRKPPDDRRRGQFRAGWEDSTVRKEVYADETLESLTWRNLGYRLGRFFGRQSPEQINQAFDVLANLYEHSKNVSDWRTEVKRWINTHWSDCDSIADSIVSFFELAFENTRCPERAWFGVHQSTVSLVVGGIFLAAIMKSSQDRGFWLLVDQQPPPIDGVEYKPVKSTHGSKFPLIWAHSASLSFIPNVVGNHLIWKSFASASEKIHYSPRIANDRNSIQERRNKKLLSEFWLKEPENLFPDEVKEEIPIREGAKYQVTVNAYERDPRARRQCIEHYGASCFICGFLFGSVYGEVAEGFIHVHHLKPLSEIGTEYTVNPIKDLRPVCPNCHAVLHLRKPAFSIEEVIGFLQPQCCATCKHRRSQ